MVSSSANESQCHRDVVVNTSEYLEPFFSLCFAAVIITPIVLCLLWNATKRGSEQTLCPKHQPQQDNPTPEDAKLSSKLEFLERNRENYGYPNSKKGFIDDWRLQEFPTLLPPLNASSGCSHNKQQHQTLTGSDCSSKAEVYLDYAGSALPTRSQLSRIYEQCVLPPSSETSELVEGWNTQVLANPHSLGAGNASDRTWKLMQQSIHRVMKHFGIDDDLLDVEENEVNVPSFSRYRLVFTTGATESLRVVAEHFPWSCLNIECQSGQTMTIQKDLTQNTKRLVQSVNIKSVLVYPKNSHTSVIGMRNVALSRGASFQCTSAEELQNASNSWFQSVIEENMDYRDLILPYKSIKSSEKLEAKDGFTPSSITPTHIIWVHHLLVLPVECNFGGDRFNWSRTVSASKASSFTTYLAFSSDTPNNDTKIIKICHKWHVLLDTAKAAATSKVNLTTIIDGKADFGICSFYKIFGHPTGLGALFIKNHVCQNKVNSINPGKEDKSTTHRQGLQCAINEQPTLRHYFGGGSVDVVLPHVDFTVSRKNKRKKLSSVDSKCYEEEFIDIIPFSNGTQNFRGIVELAHGFHEIDSLGGMTKIFSHSTCLAAELVRQFNSLRHDNGKRVVCIYGQWRHKQKEGAAKFIGPTVAFNILDRDGAIIGYDEVSKLASLNQPSIQLRTGCFCNPGACQDALALLDEEIIENWRGGHVCGDRRGKINGRPTGCIRASFGKDSLWEDMDALISFIGKMFVSHENSSRFNENFSPSRIDSRFEIERMYIFPIKSCAAIEVHSWPIECNTGKLLFDRDFALVDPSGVAMRLSSYPKMSVLQPSINMANEVMVVSAPEHEDLILSLKRTSNANPSAQKVEVCGVLCNGNIWGGIKASNWFTSVLGLRCWLVRHDESKNENTSLSQKSYSNEAALLLVSQNSIARLNSIIASQGWGKQVESRHFRPNIVVSTSVAINQSETADYNPEDSWKTIIMSGKNGQVKLLSAGKCARCQMVDVDPSSGMKGNTLKALAQYRRDRGRIYFGTFFSGINDLMENDSGVIWFQVGDNVQPI